MWQTLTIHPEGPIMSAKILDNYPSPGGVNSGADAEQALIQDLEAQKAVLPQVCQTLQEVVVKLNQFYDKVLVEHKEQIARLSVEIARKILAQKVQQGDYEIESIVKEALKNAPTHQDLVVHLNPEDLVQCQKVLEDNSSDVLSGIKLVPDPNIGRAECVVETPKGIIESLIDEHLEQVGKVLSKAE